MEWIVILVGFALAAYSIVANDAIQTLGTFLSSNADRPWWLLWLFTSSILAAVLVFGWLSHDGDVSYGRLAGIGLPRELSWVHVVPPVALLLLTRSGMPVSTTFLIFTVFAPQSLASMVLKSVFGYVFAFALGLALYSVVANTFERRCIATGGDTPGRRWVIAQWGATALLWSQWLVQDLANIYVYLPRRVEGWHLALSLVLMVGLLAVLVRRSGGAIQKVVTTKTGTSDIRSATIIDLLFGAVLLLFHQHSAIPMSTTWVFLGLLGGRELAITLQLRRRSLRGAAVVVGKDLAKAAVGLLVSVALALGLPWLIEGTDADQSATMPPLDDAAAP